MFHAKVDLLFPQESHYTRVAVVFVLCFMLPVRRGSLRVVRMSDVVLFLTNAHLTQCSSNVHICAMFYSTWIKRVCSRKEGGNSEFQSWIIVWRIYMKKTDDENCIFHGRVAYVICLNMSRNDVVYLDTLELYVFYGYRLDSRHFRKKKKWKRRFMMMNFFCWEYYSEWVLVKSRNARWKFMWKSYKTRASWHVFIFTFSQFIFVVSNEIN